MSRRLETGGGCCPNPTPVFCLAALQFPGLWRAGDAALHTGKQSGCALSPCMWARDKGYKNTSTHTQSLISTTFTPPQQPTPSQQTS